LFKWPKTRETFWKSKILRNRDRDQENIAALVTAGYRVRVIWECETRLSQELFDEIADKTARWVRVERNV
jgi:DNA mismatch endonuclease (patch repair protein)